MNGRYFRENGSIITGKHQSTISYAYIPIRYRDNVGSENTFDKYYPINLIISDKSIRFYHSNLLSEPNEDLNYYQSDSILTLSLEDNKELSDTLLTLGKAVEKENNIFIKSKALDFNLRGKEKALSSDFLKNMLPSLTGQTNENQYYKILFLNFLSDFFYSNVFKSHPKYKETRKTLEENKIIETILTKGKYLYTLKKANESLNNNSLLNTNKHWSTQLTKTTKKWHKLITNKNYDEVIHVDNKWFLDKESEHIALVENENISENLSVEELSTSVKWLSNRYNLFDAFKLQISFFFRKTTSKLGNRERIISSYVISLAMIIFAVCKLFDLNSICKFISIEWEGNGFDSLSWLYWTFVFLFLPIIYKFRIDTRCSSLKKIKRQSSSSSLKKRIEIVETKIS